MAHENKVVHSVNLYGEGLCVDVFQRPDGTYGFEEFRRDPEDPRGWYPVGFYGAQRFDSFEAAQRNALQQVAWLKDRL